MISDLFVEDLEFAITKGVENQLWKLNRSLINSVTSAKGILKVRNVIFFVN